MNAISNSNNLSNTVFQYGNKNTYFLSATIYQDGENPSFFSDKNNPSAKFISSSFDEQKNILTLNFSSIRNIWVPKSGGKNNALVSYLSFSLYLPTQTNFSLTFNMNDIDLSLTKTSMKFKPKNKQAFILNLPTVYYGKTVYNKPLGSFTKKIYLQAFQAIPTIQQNLIYH